jgi:hypothetical protein
MTMREKHSLKPKKDIQSTEGCCHQGKAMLPKLGHCVFPKGLRLHIGTNKIDLEVTTM